MFQFTESIRAAAVAAATGELTAALLRRYGPFMGADDLAAMLDLTTSGLRMRRRRGASLPRAMDDGGQLRWSTAQVALWLVGAEERAP